MANSQTQPKAPSLLLALPIELRMQVYQAVLSIAQNDFQSGLELGVPTSTTLQFLLTCRQIYEEARFIAFRRSTFILDIKPKPARRKTAYFDHDADGDDEDATVSSHTHITLRILSLTPEHRRCIQSIYLGYSLKSTFFPPKVAAEAMIDCLRSLPGLRSFSIPLYCPSPMEIREGWVATFETFWLGSTVETFFKLMAERRENVDLISEKMGKAQYNLPFDISMDEIASTFVIEESASKRFIDLHVGWVPENMSRHYP